MQVLGTAPLTYQWVIRGTPSTNLVNGITANGSTIAGATSSTLSISGTTAADAGNYALTVTDGSGIAVTSTAVSLAVIPPVSPTITNQPVSTTVTAGNEASFAVTASGSYPRTYQWYKGAPPNGSAVAGATSVPFTITYPLAADAGTYYVVVSNSQGSATSSAATLTVNPATPLSVSSISAPTTVSVGQNISLYVSLYGSGPVTYQWSKDGTAIPGATNSYYSVTAAATTEAGTYTVTATNAAGSITSSGITVTVNPPVAPTFSLEPQGASVAYGAYLGLYASANGAPSPTYQWYKDGVAISGATDSTYVVNSVTTVDAGTYTVKATNSGGTVTSAAAVVQVAAAIAPIITTQPASVSVPQGDSTFLSVAVSGTMPMTYVWKKDGLTITGATNPNYSISSVQGTDGGSYTVTISNVAGNATSQAAVLTVAPPAPPAFYSSVYPSLESITVGSTLSVSTPSIVSGIGPFTYQWYKDGAAISGATASTYSKSNAQVSDSGSYVVSVTNAGGTASAPLITETVVPPANTGTAWIDAKQQGTVAYFLFADHIERYDLAGATWLSGATFTQTATVFCVASDGVYIGFGRSISKYSLDLSSQTALANLTGSIMGLFSHGSYVYAITSNSTYPVDRTSGAVGAALSNLSSPNSMPTPSVVVGDKLFVETTTGLSLYSFSSTGPGATWAVSSSSTYPPPSHVYLFPDQLRVADSSGTAFNATDDSADGAFGGAFTDMTFLSDGTPVVLRGNVLYKYGGNGGYGETGRLALSAQGRSVFASGNTILVFAPGSSTSSNSISVTPVSAATLMTGSVAPTVDPTGKTYSASDIVQDGNGIVYLLSRARANVFRWSPATQGYLSSIPLAGAPSSLAYSNTRHRLYCVYSTGAVTQVDTTAAVPMEVSFGSFPSAVGDVVAADDFLFALCGSSDTAILDADGRITEFRDGVYSVGTYTWCSANQSLFGTDGSGIESMTLTSAGKLGSGAVWFGGPTSSVAGSTFPSPNGSRVLAATGQVYEGDLSILMGTLANSVTDAVWLGASPVTVRETSSGSEVQLWSAASLKLSSSAQLPGSPLRLLPLSGNRLLLVTQSSGAPAFTILNNDLQVSSTTVPPSDTTGAPVFTLQPSGSISSYAGSAVDLAVATSGAQPQTFQWYKNGAAITGATGSTLSFPSLTSTDAANYYVAATNSQGTINSVTVTVGVFPVLQFTTQPQSQAVPSGTRATLTATLAEGETASYQWYRNGSPISGATSATLVTDKVDSVMLNGDKYYAAATNPAGTVFSSVAIITIKQSTTPVITGTSWTSVIAPGGKVSFAVAATGNGPLSYQWYKNGAAISGATASTYIISNVATSDSGSFSVSVSDGSGTTLSVLMALIVAPKPAITTQPASSSVPAGSIVNLVVVATSTLPVDYQWFFNGSPISGATDATYTIRGITAAAAGSYYVSVSNPAGAVNSDTATVSIPDPGPPPTITTQPSSQTVKAGMSVTFSVDAYTPTGSLSFQWDRNSVAIAGATNSTYTIASASSADAGLYTVHVMSSGGEAQSSALLTVQARSFAGTYFGTFSNGGKWAMYIGPDNTGTYIAYLPQNLGSVVLNVMVANDGSIVVPVATVALAIGPANVPQPRTAQASTTISAQISSGAVTGTLIGPGLTLTGTQDYGTSSNLSGYYSAPALDGAAGAVYTVVGGSGQAMVLTVTGTSSDYATGTLGATGQLSATTTGGSSVSMTVDTGSRLASTTVTPSGGSGVISYAGLPSGVSSTTRLVNVSVRGMAGSGDNVLVGGFAVTGGTKKILVRGIGPTLTNYGVSNALTQPLLTLFDANSVKQWSGTAWGGSSSLAVLFKQVGAFSLGGTSSDAATAIPDNGNMTVQVEPSAGGDPGIALAEIYDADVAPGAARLVNLSGRANTGSGTSILSAGFVINGTGTETVLLRGIGPTLSTFHVAGALSAAQLTLFDANSKPIVSNAGWAGDSTLSATFTKVGAFALPSNSADAALLVTLVPGSYTVQVAGTNGATGVALVEIYEVK
ncbi:MAG TPA: immunoglobulin domain-containing protein [Opitutaceae bacterium]|nr:immunoglobulin domain-containing protein [Opitutaceae bacterium]